jgi:hypothetical protein
VERSYQVFYSCYGLNEHVDGQHPIPATKSQVRILAIGMLAGPDDFFGIIDGRGTTLQIAVDPKGYWVEIPAPQEKGSHVVVMDLQRLIALLEELPEFFGVESLPGARFEPWSQG